MADTNKTHVPVEPTESEVPTTPAQEDSETENQETEEVENPVSLDDLDTLFKLLGLNQAPQRVVNSLGEDRTLENVANQIKSGKIKKIIVLSGAGISVAAGIPDFRSPGTGLYDNLQKYNLPHPTAVFELGFFRKNPKPFYELAREMYPGKFKPTPAHYFIRLLQQKGLLVCNFTQNVDTLERVAGIPEDYLVEAHGSFASARCIECKKEHSVAWLKEIIYAAELTIPQCTVCKASVKPEIVFFGESLPARFFEKTQGPDFDTCDLLLVIGTSLQVHPFASLANFANKTTPRVLINRELVGNFDHSRDVIVLDDIQDAIHRFVKLLGWDEEFAELLSSTPPSLF